MKCKDCKHFTVDVEMQMKLGSCKVKGMVTNLVKKCQHYEKKSA